MILSVHVPHVQPGHTKMSHFGPVRSGTILFLRYRPKVLAPAGSDGWRCRYSTLDDRRSTYLPSGNRLTFSDI